MDKSLLQEECSRLKVQIEEAKNTIKTLESVDKLQADLTLQSLPLRIGQKLLKIKWPHFSAKSKSFRLKHKKIRPPFNKIAELKAKLQETVA